MEGLVAANGLIEGPVWEAARGLLFSDVIGAACLVFRSNQLSEWDPRRDADVLPHAVTETGDQCQSF